MFPGNIFHVFFLLMSISIPKIKVRYLPIQEILKFKESSNQTGREDFQPWMFQINWLCLLFPMFPCIQKVKVRYQCNLELLNYLSHWNRYERFCKVKFSRSFYFKRNVFALIWEVFKCDYLFSQGKCDTPFEFEPGKKLQKMLTSHNPTFICL